MIAKMGKFGSYPKGRQRGSNRQIPKAKAAPTALFEHAVKNSMVCGK